MATDIMVHRIELFIVDYEGFGIEEYQNLIDGYKYLDQAIIGDVKSVIVGGYDGQHPLNLLDQQVAYLHSIFGLPS